MSNNPDIVVVGGGAAGLIASARAAELGNSVVLLEKNDRLGMKILISGGGKCNLTHAGPMEELRSRFRTEEARFLKPSFYKYTNNQFLEILHGRGVETYARPDGRIFPVEPGDAKTVVRHLAAHVLEKGVEVRLLSPVSGLLVNEGRVHGVRVNNETVYAPKVIVAVGGSSYPATGTTGDGWRWLKDLGHTVKPLVAALAPISIRNPRTEWSGIALRSVELKGRRGKQGKEFVRWLGDVLYTHKGISGPSALGISRSVAEQIVQFPAQTPFIEADLVPGLPYESLRENLRNIAVANPKRLVHSLIEPYGPARVVAALFELAEVDPATRTGQLPAKALTKLVTLIKEWPIGDVSHVPLERGEVVAGGIDLSEVDSQTMESKIVRGLYLCGEVLDIAGPVGGYNLQAAWSTGFVAGSSAPNK